MLISNEIYYLNRCKDTDFKADNYFRFGRLLNPTIQVLPYFDLMFFFCVYYYEDILFKQNLKTFVIVFHFFSLYSYDIFRCGCNSYYAEFIGFVLRMIIYVFKKLMLYITYSDCHRNGFSMSNVLDYKKTHVTISRIVEVRCAITGRYIKYFYCDVTLTKIKSIH